MSLRKIFLAVCLLGSSLLIGQSNIDLSVESTQAQYLGRTPALRTLIPIAPDWEVQKAKDHRKNFKVPPNFRNRRPYTAVNDAARPGGPDPLARSVRNGTITVEPSVNIEGQSGQNSPQDPS
ncbi:MAG: hypothetical protein AAF840_02205, partial [Bacteroidota bacterium]